MSDDGVWEVFRSQIQYGGEALRAAMFINDGAAIALSAGIATFFSPWAAIPLSVSIAIFPPLPDRSRRMSSTILPAIRTAASWTEVRSGCA